MSEPVGLHNFSHQVLLHFLDSMSAVHQLPHIVERLGHARIVHVVAAPDDVWVQAWTLRSELQCLILTLRLAIGARTENIEAFPLICAALRHASLRN